MSAYAGGSVREKLSEQAKRILGHIGDEGYVLRIRSRGRSELVFPPPRAQTPGKVLTFAVPIEAAHELIDSGLLIHLEVDMRKCRFGLTELGLYSIGDFYACRG